jgi:predicted metal-dependent peptidase
MNVYEEVVKHSKKLMFDEPFYGLMLIGMNKELSERIDTACVTRDNINTKLMVNPEFWATLDESTKTGVLKHELLHIAFFHLLNMDNFPDRKLHNVAADLEINQYIEDKYKGEKWDGLEIHKEPFAKLNLEPKQGTKYYYSMLQEEIQNNPEGDIAEFMEGMDPMHELWEAFDGLSDAEKKLIAKQIDHQLKEIADQVNKNHGTIPGELKDYVLGLFEMEEPVLDWKAYLRRFNGMSQKILTKKTRRKPSRRYPSNPALKIKPKKRTLVAIDTSGSVNNNELIEFFNEIYHMYKTGTEITVVECDAQIQREYEYKGVLEEIKVAGRGGTDFEPVMVYLKEHQHKFQNLIYFTDGECSAPETKPMKPILWVHSSRSSINEELPGAKIKITR